MRLKQRLLKLQAIKKKKEEAPKIKGPEYVPFKYIKQENLRQLIYLIRREPPASIALVVSYLKPEYVKEILSSLPPELQAQVAIEMATVRLMTQEELMAFDGQMKEKIDFVIGGLDHLLKVLDKVDSQTLDNILDYLKNEKPDLYEKVKKFIITFEDIPTFPDIAMQVVIRELKSESLARGLRNAPPDILEKFFTNMSVSAAAMLKEEMEYGRPATEEEINDERKKIVELVKTLEKDGKIFVREKPKNAILEGDGDLTGDKKIKDAGGSGAPGELEEYYSAGVGYYEAGQYEDALSYFEYCLASGMATSAFYQYLGGSYYALGRYNESIMTYEKALAVEPDNDELRNWLESVKISG
jgi:flagellar motor switch protein FliG